MAKLVLEKESLTYDLHTEAAQSGIVLSTILPNSLQTTTINNYWGSQLASKEQQKKSISGKHISVMRVFDKAASKNSQCEF